MGDKSAIEWTEASWNPLHGCSRVSEGCRHCYAERLARRLPDWEQIVHRVGNEWRWTGDVVLREKALTLPLHWRTPRRIFVNSMSDLFHEKVDEWWLVRIFNIMWQAEQHTFQVLTKRPERMRVFMSEGWRQSGLWAKTWPPQNVWLGVSVEDQATADKRIPLLLQTPAAVRWVSYEPALGPVDFRQWLPVATIGCFRLLRRGVEFEHWLDWIVVGGESGSGARPFDLAWARQTIAQCRAAGVPVFVKQLGARPLGEWRYGEPPHYWLTTYGRDERRLSQHRDRTWKLLDRKGGDPTEWPEDLRVREYPAAV